jgi:Uma2 family endonuclease
MHCLGRDSGSSIGRTGAHPATAGSTTYYRTAKADTYAALGVRELWLVDLERKAIEQRVLEAVRWRVAGVHAGSAAFEVAVFPGLTVVPEDVFAPA